MSFFKRIFYRPQRTVPGKGSSPEMVGPKDSSFDKIVVPPGHHLNIYAPASKPVIQTTNDGAIIANLGTSSDEFQEEFHQIVGDVDRLISSIASNGGAKRLPIMIPAEECRISDLFAPNDMKVTPYPGLLLWVLDAGTAHLWLRDPEPLHEAIRQAGLFRFNSGPITQFVLFNIELWMSRAIGSEEWRQLPPSGTLELAHLLSDAGVTTAAIPNDKKFYIEVTRPDCILSMLRTEPLPDECASLEIISSVDRAPHLHRLVLAAIEDPSERTQLKLFEELLTREIPLVIVNDREGIVNQMSWPEIGEAVPVYPDISSAYFAAEDLRSPMDSFSLAYFSPRDLFTWADEAGFGGIALNTYKDRKNPRYLFIPKNRISSLARLFSSGSH